MSRNLANAGLRNTAASNAWRRSNRASHASVAPQRRRTYPHPLAGDGLPGVAQEIADVIGRDRALYLIGQLPRAAKVDSRYPLAAGTQLMLYVPKKLKPDSLLVRVLGVDDAQALVNMFAGTCLTPPACIEVYRRFRDRSILELVGDGLANGLVAEAVGVKLRHVQRVRATAGNPAGGCLES